MVTGLFKLSLLYWVSCGSLCSVTNQSILVELLNLRVWAVQTVLILSPYVYRVYGDICCFILGTGNLSLLFSFVRLARGLSIALIFFKKQLFYWFPLLIFCFQFHRFFFLLFSLLFLSSSLWWFCSLFF